MYSCWSHIVEITLLHLPKSNISNYFSNNLKKVKKQNIKLVKSLKSNYKFQKKQI